MRGDHEAIGAGISESLMQGRSRGDEQSGFSVSLRGILEQVYRKVKALPSPPINNLRSIDVWVGK